MKHITIYELENKSQNSKDDTMTKEIKAIIQYAQEEKLNHKSISKKTGQ